MAFDPHQRALSEFIAALGWVFVDKTPMGHVQAQFESSDFYLTKVLTQNKDSADKDHHRAFVKAIKDLTKEASSDLQAYIKEYHRTGLTWNAKGKDLSEFGAAAASAPAGPPKVAGPPVAGPPMGPPVGGPPMGPPSGLAGPPVGLAPPPAVAAPSSEPAAAAGLGAVFASINQGHGALVSGLRKVTDNMKSRDGKMAEELASKPVPVAKTAPKPAAVAAPAAAAKAPAQEPRMFEKQGKWFVEHYTGGVVTIPADELNQKQNVYVFKCTNTCVVVPAKCKAICVDNCSKSQVICESVVSTVEVVNCKSVAVQINVTV
jgi:adenylyl cyclase-associated protein